jgi:hypothetical protein
MPKTQHNTQQRLNPKWARDSIIGFVLSHKALSSILVNHPKYQFPTAQTKRASATPSFEVSQNLHFRSVCFCTGTM